MSLRERIADKILSGRFILTIIAGCVFAALSIMKVLPVDKIHEVILIVIYGYFTRTDRTKKEEK